MMEKLTALQVKNAKANQRLSDGDGLRMDLDIKQFPDERADGEACRTGRIERLII